jgi:hypothetical protein
MLGNIQLVELILWYHKCSGNIIHIESKSKRRAFLAPASENYKVAFILAGADCTRRLVFVGLVGNGVGRLYSMSKDTTDLIR